MGSLGGETARKKAMWLYPKVLGFNPSERWGHSACFSEGVMYIFGGCCGGLHFSDVLILNLDTMAWSTLTTIGKGPGPRDSHSAVLARHWMIVFGGTNGCRKVNDVHILDLDTKEWMQPECKGTRPSPRESHTATLVGDERLVIFGGSGEGDANYLNDLHILDLQTMRWTSPEVKGDMPVPRDSHSTVAVGNKLFVYGGDSGDHYHGNADMLDMETMTWTRLTVQGSSPGVRAGHAAVTIGTKVYVIGGVGDKHYYNDVWILDVSICSWTQLNICGQQPQGQFSHTAVIADSDIVIYGGCGEDERPLNTLLVLQLGAEHPNGRYNISMCKPFGNHWNQEKRRFQRGADNNSQKTILMGNNMEMLRKGTHEFDSENKQPFQFDSDTLQQKRRRTADPKLWDVETEQEEHSLSLSQQSSPSQSDQEQNPAQIANASVMGSQGFHLFKPLNHIPSGCQPDYISSNQRVSKNIIQRTGQDLHIVENQGQTKLDQLLHVHLGRQGGQYPPADQKTLEARPIQNLIGAEVRGKVDGAFDSGFLMTATVNGRIFRGVLFSPVHGIVSRGNTLVQNSSFRSQFTNNTQPFPISNHVDKVRHSQQPVTSSVPESCQRSQKAQVTRPFPIITATPSLAKDQKIRSDLQGVVLTLGGPASGN
ncbi:BTB-kelch protein [Quillaja saponaria]|uniref:BTB-kelch protein n=1 Tax=Quillaja saponaria TaxID=32244 RepID=A0AAD7Q1R5_QUISA|nr:BTB-kelch protein [Quillaja saponaria]